MDGDGEADVLDGRAACGGAGILGGGDADHVSVHVEQRAAGVAGVERRIGLDHAHGRVLDGDVAVKTADIAVRHGEVQFAEGIADRNDRIADLKRVFLRDGDGGKPLRVDLEQGNIAHRVRADDGSRIGLAVIERNGHDGRTVDHVAVCEDKAV